MMSHYQRTVKEAVGELYVNEPGEVRGWIDELPRGELRDAALVSESSAMMFGPERREAMARINQIEDEVVREKQLQKFRKRAESLGLDDEHPAAIHNQEANSQ